MSEVLDRRLHAYRPDLADQRLEGKVESARFVEGRVASVVVPFADMRPSPDTNRGIDTQLLLGDTVTVYDHERGWAWCQAERDGYVGYVRTDALSMDTAPPKPTHRVRAPRSFSYLEPDLKQPMVDVFSLGSAVAVVEELEQRGTRYAILNDGTAMIADHLCPLQEEQHDYVTVAETLLHTPYLWGGSTAFGMDCSGLVQLSMLMCGKRVLRDSDMQAASIGNEMNAAANLERGDLVFWKGHVGIMSDAKMLIHANAHTMTVAYEPLAEAINRIAYLYGQPTIRRRP